MQTSVPTGELSVSELQRTVSSNWKDATPRASSDEILAPYQSAAVAACSQPLDGANLRRWKFDRSPRQDPGVISRSPSQLLGEEGPVNGSGAERQPTSADAGMGVTVCY